MNSIAQFNPHLINIPINKCELEETIETLVSLMFPICDCPESIHIQDGLLKAAETLHENIEKLHNRQAADEKTEAFSKNFHHYRNDYSTTRPAICNTIRQPRHWRR